ncbi:hypothetical protein POM88_006153 [Heracleum sosnowskyi]|uniref:Disease resistance R13L4/SHOC-2-like LRR domain-containing protein n=1 Tax=Heracleum sosnowskyi TaxID=360622 RepID=A0AAD8J239_9APIA|nr:hypothetical protein POM88_006153 [Heracleum sosnowskyi]
MYLLDLVRRSLVVVGKRRSNGAIKSCRIHDLFHDLCLRKAEEHNFSSGIYRYNKHSYSCPHSLNNPSTKSRLYLGTNHILTIPSYCSSCISEVSSTFFKDVSIVWDTSKLIRTWDISSIDLVVFPSELLQLVHLRYLELRFRSGNPPESISLLSKLHTVIMSSKMSIVVPKNMWKIITLKHLCIKSGENFVSIPNVEELSLLENLQTMSLVSPTRPCQNILARTRNLQKLGLCGPLTTKSGDFHCPDLGHLMHLETLKLLNALIPSCKAGRLRTSVIFPASLKNLTMLNTYLDWKEAWVFEIIPHLEVLKLKRHALVGKNWETSPEAFPRLKFLKLYDLDIETWTASRNHFPVLTGVRMPMSD